MPSYSFFRNPIVVGGSVIGLYFKNGVMIASDTGACYGSIKMFKQCQRIEKINNNVLIGFESFPFIYQSPFQAANGEMSDFQEVTLKLKEVDKKARIFDDNTNHSPKDFANFLGFLG